MPNLEYINTLNSSSVGAAIEVTVSNIASPTELNSRAAIQGDLVLARTTEAGTGSQTLYYADTTSDSESLPYIVSSATAGVKFIACGGRYNNGSKAIGGLTASRLVRTDASKNLESNAVLTNTRVLYADSNGWPADSANLTFSGTLLTLGTGATGGLTIAATTGTTLTVSSTTDSTSKDTGSIVTEGGIGVEKAVNIGTTLTVGSTSNTAAVTLSGGVSQTVTITDPGATTYANSTTLNYALTSNGGQVVGQRHAVSTTNNAFNYTSAIGLRAFYLTVSHTGTGTVTGMTGGISEWNVTNTGNVTNAYGHRYSCAVTAASTVTTGRGVYIGAPQISGGGAITTFNGLEIEPITGAGTNRAIYTQGAGLVVISDTTDSTSKDTGSIVTEGGIGAEKAIRSGTRFGLAQAAGSTTDGDIWSDSTQKALQTYVDGIEQTLSGCIFTQTATRTIANTVAETSLFTTGVGTLTLPANFFVAGKTVRLTLTGHFADTGTPTVRLRLKFGATTVIDSTALTLSAVSGTEEWRAVCDLTCRTTGGTGTLAGSIWFLFDTTTGAGAINGLDISPAVTTVDTTASSALDLTWQWGAADPANTASCLIASVEVVN
jgi:hypothetical protein